MINRKIALDMRRAGKSLRDIAAHFGVSKQRIHKILQLFPNKFCLLCGADITGEKARKCCEKCKNTWYRLQKKLYDEKRRHTEDYKNNRGKYNAYQREYRRKKKEEQP